MKPTEIKSFIAECTNEVWNRGHIDAMNCYYAPNYLHHDVSRPDVQSLADYKQWARGLMAELTEFRVGVEDLIAEEDKAVKRWTAYGTQSHELAGIPATGKRVQFSGVSIYRIAGNRIAESWYVYNLMGLLQQLTSTPAAEHVAK